ncbi:Ragulator complex protein LAMTOR1 [Anabarilius grahami]|uniref:Ragulator complex protein LAMTOR1 n=1 Tax=Anabarilius grahami TaxID=495550 RepID=A0A3N0XSM0_ANAGA|nr:Ragulator complex protein LAMTOR1 [Anabarilius grahami]
MNYTSLPPAGEICWLQAGEEYREGRQNRDEVKPLIPDPNQERKPTNGSERNADNLMSNRTDEQALLTVILQRTALNIIDVSAVDSQGMEQHEYMDRARQYSTKLEVLSRTLSQKKPVPLPSLTSQPHQVLAADLVPYADIQQILPPAGSERHFISRRTDVLLGRRLSSVGLVCQANFGHRCCRREPTPQSAFVTTFVGLVSKIAAYAYSAISQIKVDAKEELVVQFAIP